jgi:hypothetical protein
MTIQFLEKKEIAQQNRSEPDQVEPNQGLHCQIIM